MNIKPRLLISVAIVLAVLAGFEWLARKALPRMPSCTEVFRQPFRYCGWPEYMRVKNIGCDATTVVLLTNCQGYGSDVPSKRIYPVLLEQLLNEKRVGGRENWKVLNWAVDGITSIEYMIMAAALKTAPPAMVLAVTAYGDYRSEHFKEGYLFCRSDAPRLALRRGILRNLPRTFLMRHAKVEDCLAVWMEDHVALCRFKEYMWCWLHCRFPGVHNVFYAPLVNYMPWAIRAKAWVPDLEIKTPSDLTLNITYDERSRTMLDEYLRSLSGLPTRVLVINEPRASPNDPADIGRQRQFQKDLSQLSRSYGLTCMDLQDALKQDGFLTSNHLKRQNHYDLATLLAARIADVLKADPGAAPPEAGEKRESSKD